MSSPNGDVQARPPFYAKAAAASIGATLTGLTMTPFDVVKTRLQTQVPTSQIPKPPLPPNTCCLPSSMNCVRSMSSLALSSPASSSFASTHFANHAIRSNAKVSLPPASGNFVCLWDAYGMRTQRVTGFGDAIMKVWAAEGVRGLWKGVGTTLLIAIPSQTAYMLTYDSLLHTIPNILPPATSQSPVIAPLVPLVSGILARTTISTCASPLELLRTRLQSTPISPTTPHTLQSVMKSISSMVRAEGPLSLWKGLSATLWRDVPFSGVYWALYETTKGMFERNGYTGAGVAFVCGATSGTTAAVITSPFDVIKTRRQALLLPSPDLVDGSSASSIASSARRATDTRTFSLAMQIMRMEGYKALYAGLTPRIAKIAPACGIMIASYEGLGAFLAQSSRSLS